MDEDLSNKLTLVCARIVMDAADDSKVIAEPETASMVAKLDKKRPLDDNGTEGRLENPAEIWTSEPADPLFGAVADRINGRLD